MMRKVPIIDSSAGLIDIIRAVKRSAAPSVFREFAAAVSRRSGGRYAYLANSGITAFYIILKALSGRSDRTEVILPAYTAGSLVTAVRKAGLRPILCDISLRDFNSDTDSLMNAVSGNTLAVACVHMFGVAMAGVDGLDKRLPPGITVIEDCAQAMGSSVGGRGVGGFGDIAFFSFNRGKNLSVCGGGCITTDSSRLSEAICRVMKNPGNNVTRFNPAALIKVIAFSVAVNPYIYGACYGAISRFKENAPPLDFIVGGIDGYQAALGLGTIKRFDLLASKRYENGMFLINGLKGLDGVLTPEIRGADKPAFNRFPIVFKDRGAMDLVAGRLWRLGIESSRMYIRPLHHMFDLGYAQSDFPNACYAAQRLLTLPVHPSVSCEWLARAVDVIRGVSR